MRSSAQESTGNSMSAKCKFNESKLRFDSSRHSKQQMEKLAARLCLPFAVIDLVIR